MISCRSCKKTEEDVSFSKSQRKKPQGEARCTNCIQNELTVEGRSSKEEPTQNQVSNNIQDKGKQKSNTLNIEENGKLSVGDTANEENDGDENENDDKYENENEIDEHGTVESDTNAEQNHVSPPPSLDRIPKRKRKRQAISMSENESDGNNEDEEQEESLDAIKRQVLGRDLHVETPNKPDTELQQVQALLNGSMGTSNYSGSSPRDDKLTIAKFLQQDLECAICRDILYPPMSLQCGHSFCQECLEWWYRTSPTCPTCRSASTSQLPSQPNHALQQCVKALYPRAVFRKLQARQLVTKGEGHGSHTRGYEILSPLEDEFWHTVKTQSIRNGRIVQMKRSIVLDSEDQRMQFALCFQSPPRLLENGIVFYLGLLHMEEDEAADSGFPTLLVHPEDEQCLCTSEQRFQYSYWQLGMKEALREDAKVTPVARLLPEVDSPGVVSIRFDEHSTPQHHLAKVVQIVHEETGATMQVDLSALSIDARLSTETPQRVSSPSSPTPSSPATSEHAEQRRSRHTSSFIMEDMDRSSDEGEDEDEVMDEFEDDGFLVPEGAEDGEDDNACQICHDGGDLMICDGGDQMEGCGKSFHVECVGRKSLPDGDWICSECAISGGINVDGKRGHEFPTQSDGEEIPRANTGEAIQDSSDDEGGDMPAAKTSEAPRRFVLEDSDDDDDDDDDDDA